MEQFVLVFELLIKHGDDMIKGELSLSHAKRMIDKGRIVYIVANSDKIIKIFDYHREACLYAESQGLKSYNITHPGCPRFIKFELGYIQQLDFFLDYLNGELI